MRGEHSLGPGENWNVEKGEKYRSFGVVWRYEFLFPSILFAFLVYVSRKEYAFNEAR